MSIFLSDKEETFKKRLLQFLEDEDVKKKLREVFEENKNSGLSFIDNVKNKSLTMEDIKKSDVYQELYDEYSRLKNDFEQKVKMLKNEAGKLEEARDEWKKKAESLEKDNIKYKNIAEQFEDVIYNFNLYCGLSPQILSNASKIIDVKYPLAFIITASDKENVLAFWDVVKYMCDDLSKDELTKIEKLLSYFIMLLNRRYSNDIFALMNNEIGASFDDYRHIRSNNCNRYQGTVARVILAGIWNNKKECAERKSIVEY